MLQLIMGVNTSWEGRIGLSYRIGEGNLGSSTELGIQIRYCPYCTLLPYFYYNLFK